MPVPSVSSVVITRVDPQTAKVGQIVRVYATAYLTTSTPYESCVEFVLAVNNTSNIVKRNTECVVGVNSVDTVFELVFNSPGTYTLIVGARYIGY